MPAFILTQEAPIGWYKGYNPIPNPQICAQRVREDKRRRACFCGAVAVIDAI